MSFADLLTYHLCAHYVLGVQAGKSRTVLGQLTSTFYATIPHAFGMRAGPIITDLSTVEEKYNMINTLRDIDTAQQMLRDDSDAAPAEHPLDAKYRQLKTDLTFVGQDDDDHEVCAALYHKWLQLLCGFGCCLHPTVLPDSLCGIAATCTDYPQVYSSHIEGSESWLPCCRRPGQAAQYLAC